MGSTIVYDHFKGSILSGLKKRGILLNLQVNPKLTDNWDDNDYKIYAELLKIDQNDMLKCDDCDAQGDLFFDPNIGVKTKGCRGKNYIAPADIRKKLDENKRVVVVYQHIRCMDTHKRMNDIVFECFADYHCCSYESSSACILFISVDPNRINEVYKYYCSILGEQAIIRIHIWHS